MGPYRHISVFGDIVAELGGGLFGSVLVGDGHVLAVGDGHAEHEGLGAVLVHVDRNDIIRLVILHGDGAGLGEIKAAVKEGDIRPAVDDTDLTALEGQPDTVLAHGGKLIVIFGKTEGDIARIVGNGARSIGHHIHGEGHEIRLGLLLQGQVGVLAVHGGQMSIRGDGHLVDVPLVIILPNGLGEVLGVFVLNIGLGLGSRRLGLLGNVIHEVVGLGLLGFRLGNRFGGLLHFCGRPVGGSLGVYSRIIPAAGRQKNSRNEGDQKNHENMLVRFHSLSPIHKF